MEEWRRQPALALSRRPFLGSLGAKPALFQRAHLTKWPLMDAEAAVGVLGRSHLRSAESVFTLRGGSWGGYAWGLVGGDSDGIGGEWG